MRRGEERRWKEGNESEKKKKFEETVERQGQDVRYQCCNLAARATT